MTATRLFTEVWLARRMNRAPLFEGVTTPEVRMERVRREIRVQRIADSFAGVVDGHRITYAEAFERLYGEGLEAQDA